MTDAKVSVVLSLRYLPCASLAEFAATLLLFNASLKVAGGCLLLRIATRTASLWLSLVGKRRMSTVV